MARTTKLGEMSTVNHNNAPINTNDSEAIKIFHDHGNDESKMNHLIQMAEREDIETFKVILHDSPDEVLNLQHDGCKLIHLLTILRNSSCVAAILDYDRTATDSQNIDGFTALHFAVELGSMEMIRLLIQYNADIFMENSNGENAIDIAKKFRPHQVLDYLTDRVKEEGASPPRDEH